MDILALDEILFRAVNVDGHNAFFDFLLPFMRNKYFWAPFYIFLLSLILVNFKKAGLLFVLSLILCVALTDNISSRLIKKTVKRERPCRQQSLSKDVKLLARCGVGYSFPSSHATNHFGVALFLILGLGSMWKWIKWPLIIWAGMISYAQVYVGVHFPF
ncbi:MAG: phosphatase PAP2 family protein, partial [Saprospiraceae bacterium]|nr:phosphatase PAP2 family protein [Saprospiraceae bacterium]